MFTLILSLVIAYFVVTVLLGIVSAVVTILL